MPIVMKDLNHSSDANLWFLKNLSFLLPFLPTKECPIQTVFKKKNETENQL